MRYTDEMAEWAEEALRKRFPVVGEDDIVDAVQTVLMAATRADGPGLRTRLPVTIGSAAVPEGSDQVEVALLSTDGQAWEFEIGPVAAGTFALMLREAQEKLEGGMDPGGRGLYFELRAHSTRPGQTTVEVRDAEGNLRATVTPGDDDNEIRVLSRWLRDVEVTEGSLSDDIRVVRVLLHL